MNDHKQIIEACRISGAAFASTVFPRYETPPHILEIWRLLEMLARGDINRLILTAPPRHGKSKTVSEIFPAWWFGHHPESEVMLISNSDDLATGFGRNIRNTMLDKNYEKIFPRSKLAHDSQSKSNFHTIAGGRFQSAGIEGQLTGKGAKLMILDDTIKTPEQAYSANYRQKLKDFYDYVATTRLTEESRVVAMHTRWHADDLIGWLTKERSNEGWVEVNFKALQDDGTALWDKIISADRLRKIQENNPQMFAAIYQQSPIQNGGNIIKSEWWKYYTELPAFFDMVIQSWDLSFAEGENNAYTVGQVWGRRDNKAYLLYQIREKMGFNKQIQAILNVTQMFPNAAIKLIENKANFHAINDVLKNKIAGITPVEPKGSKELRATSVSSFIFTGQCHLPDPKLNPWVLDFVDEAAIFPNGQYADQVDTMSQALMFLFSGEDFWYF